MQVAERLRLLAYAALAAGAAILLHVAIWTAWTPRTPATAAAGLGLALTSGVILLHRAWASRKPESALDAVPAERGILWLSFGMACLAEAIAFAAALAWPALPIAFGVALVAVAPLSAPWILGSLAASTVTAWQGELQDAIRVANEMRSTTIPPNHLARPPFLREVSSQVTFRDVIGLDGAKQDVTEAIRLMLNPELARAHNLEPIRGILLHGPPGTGKTHFARAAAGQFGKRFLEVRSADLVSQYVGETEKNVAMAFAYARDAAPAILFIDEIDALARNRGLARNDWEISRVTALLQELDGIAKDSRAPILIAATNRIEDLDPAILRPGRFDRKVFVGLPSAADRARLLSHLLQGNRVEAPLEAVVAVTDGMSPAELKALVQEARRIVFREGKPTPRPLTLRDFASARQAVAPLATNAAAAS